MKDADKPAPVSFKKLKSTKSDISGVGKVGDCAHLLDTSHAVCSSFDVAACSCAAFANLACKVYQHAAHS